MKHSLAFFLALGLMFSLLVILIPRVVRGAIPPGPGPSIKVGAAKNAVKRMTLPIGILVIRCDQKTGFLFS